MLGKGYIKKAWKLYMDDLAPFLLGWIILSIINAVAFSILTGPVACGMIYMTLKKLRGEKIDVSDAFKGFENFGYIFLAGIVYSIIIGVGFVFLIIPGFILGALFIFMFPFIVDKKMDFVEAFKASVNLVKDNLLEHTLFFFVAALIGVSGIIFLFIGIYFTLPLFYIAYGVAYYNLVYPAEKETAKQIET
jgi:uncharacterized membrane protein